MLNPAPTSQPAPGLQPRPAAMLASPPASFLAAFLESRVQAEEQPSSSASLPAEVLLDLRPRLPKIGTAAAMIYAHRQAVQSFPLIYTTLALAHPN